MGTKKVSREALIRLNQRLLNETLRSQQVEGDQFFSLVIFALLSLWRKFFILCLDDSRNLCDQFLGFEGK
ncbi:hypothetical protein NIES2104_22300 [Leptolyngbya sp. NIES-2104]|nr:hypothetical protein NIES2104_22300 [Leptolyngbya sp. NIES-2104]